MRFERDGTFEPELDKGRGPKLHVTFGVVAAFTLLVLLPYLYVSLGPFVGLYVLFALPFLIVGFFASLVALWSLDESSSMHEDYRDALRALPYSSSKGTGQQGDGGTRTRE